MDKWHCSRHKALELSIHRSVTMTSFSNASPHIPGTITDQTGEVVGAEALSSVNDNGSLHTQTIRDEMVVHSTYRQ